MDHATRQTFAEVEIFERFVEAAKIPWVKGSIQKRNPPEPDILCEVVGEGPVAFELVELISQDFARKINPAFNLKGQLEELFNRLLKDERDEICRRFGDAIVEVVPKKDVSYRQVQADLPKVLRALQTAQAGSEGIVPAADLGLGETEIKHLVIARGSFNGPHFDLDTTLPCDDPKQETIRGKFEKSQEYQSKAPIELLAYSEIQPPGHRSIWESSLLEYCRSDLARCAFRRIWVYDICTNEILFVYPEK